MNASGTCHADSPLPLHRLFAPCWQREHVRTPNPQSPDSTTTAGDGAAGVVLPKVREKDRDAARAFYRKYLDVKGMPVVASAEVADLALQRTYEIVTHVLAGRPDVVKAMVDRGMYLTIIGKDQVYTDLPENRNAPNPAYLNERVRGTGGFPTSFGEENLLSLPLDRYDDESIGVHEFCHTIDSTLARIDPTWRERKNALTRTRLAKGLFKDTYAGSNSVRILGRDRPSLLRLQPHQQLEPRPHRPPRAAQDLRSRRLRDWSGPPSISGPSRTGATASSRSSPASSPRPPGSRSIPTTRNSPGPASSPCSAAGQRRGPAPGQRHDPQDVRLSSRHPQGADRRRREAGRAGSAREDLRPAGVYVDVPAGHRKASGRKLMRTIRPASSTTRRQIKLLVVGQENVLADPQDPYATGAR